MKAVVYTKYGSPDVLEYKEVEKPTPKDDQVLIKIHAVSANAMDWRLLRAKPFVFRLFAGFLKPKYPILGADIAGRVEAVGTNITMFQPGDAVFGENSWGLGGFAEYVCVPEIALVKKPAGVPFEHAAAVPMAAIAALQGLRDKGKVQPGHKVLIHGAAGGVGTFAVQIAKMLGAEVTAVCSAKNADQARSLGADHVIDYTKEDFTTNGQLYDVIFAVNGSRSIFEYRRALRPGGTYLMAGGDTTQLFQALLLGPFLSMFGKKKMAAAATKANQKDLLYLGELVQTGNIVPVIDRRYPLAEVAEALRYLEAGHAKGKLVITVVNE